MKTDANAERKMKSEPKTPTGKSVSKLLFLTGSEDTGTVRYKPLAFFRLFRIKQKKVCLASWEDNRQK